jgi:hypothetical protein
LHKIGLHCCNLILGCIVIFSWFGVNQLGVGLHAYGFTDGIWPKIYGYWLSQGALLVYGLFLAWNDRRTPSPEAAVAIKGVESPVG